MFRAQICALSNACSSVAAQLVSLGQFRDESIRLPVIPTQDTSPGLRASGYRKWLAAVILSVCSHAAVLAQSPQITAVYANNNQIVVNGSGTTVGQITGGSRLTIVGSGFGTAQGAGALAISGPSFSQNLFVGYSDVQANVSWSNTNISFTTSAWMPAGNSTLTLTNNGGTAAAPVTLTVGPGTAQLPGIAAYLRISFQSASIVAGQPTSITITAQDISGNTATNYVGTVIFATSDGGAQVGGGGGSQGLQGLSYTFTAADAGTHRFPVSFSVGGAVSVSVRDSLRSFLSGSAQALVSSTDHLVASLDTGSQDSAAVLAAFPFTIHLSAINNSTLQLDTGNQDAVTVASTDLKTTNSAGGSLANPLTVNLVNGQATLNVELHTLGSQTLTFNDASASSTTTATVTVVPVFAASLAAALPVPYGQAFTVIVAAEDVKGNILPSYNGTVQEVNGDFQPVSGTQYTFNPTQDQGVHSFTIQAPSASSVAVQDQWVGFEDIAHPITVGGIGVPYGTDAGAASGGAPTFNLGVGNNSVGLIINANGPCSAGNFAACASWSLNLPNNFALASGTLSESSCCGNGTIPYGGFGGPFLRTGELFTQPLNTVVHVPSGNLSLPVSCTINFIGDPSPSETDGGNQLHCMVIIQIATPCTQPPQSPPINFNQYYTQYQEFCWQTLASKTLLADASNVTTASPAVPITIVAQGSIDFSLNAPSNAVQILWDYWLSDTYPGLGTGPFYNPGCVTGCSGPGAGAYLATEDVVGVGPIDFEVDPIMLAQLDVLPLFILYQPPGDDSNASFAQSSTVATTFSVGVQTQNQSLQTIAYSGEDDISTSFGYNPMGGPMQGQDFTSIVSPQALSVTINGMTTNTTQWNNSTQTVGSSTVAGSNSISLTTQTLSQWATPTSSVPTLTGGTGDPNLDTPGYEPFWDDIVYLATSPQFGVWYFNTGTQYLLYGYGGLYPVTISQLANCAAGNPLPIPSYLTGNITLPPIPAAECAGLAAIDPFYAWGQSAFPSGFQFGTSQSVLPLTTATQQQFKQTMHQQQMSTQNSLSVSVTDVIGNSRTGTGSGSLNVLGFFVGPQVKATSGETITTGTTTQITYSSSQSLTSTSQVGAQFNVKDQQNYLLFTPMLDTRFNTYGFSVPQPTVSAVGPAAGPTSGHTTLGVCGNNFWTGPVATVFPILGPDAPPVVSPVSPSQLSNTWLSTVTPAAPSTETIDVLVKSSGGLSFPNPAVDSFTFSGTTPGNGTALTQSSCNRSTDFWRRIWPWQLWFNARFPQPLSREERYAVSMLARQGVLPAYSGDLHAAASSATLTQIMQRVVASLGANLGASQVESEGDALAVLGSTLKKAGFTITPRQLSQILRRFEGLEKLKPETQENIALAVQYGILGTDDKFVENQRLSVVDLAMLTLRFKAALAEQRLRPRSAKVRLNAPSVQ
jgi:hypothetical protein